MYKEIKEPNIKTILVHYFSNTPFINQTLLNNFKQSYNLVFKLKKEQQNFLFNYHVFYCKTIYPMQFSKMWSSIFLYYNVVCYDVIVETCYLTSFRFLFSRLFLKFYFVETTKTLMSRTNGLTIILFFFALAYLWFSNRTFKVVIAKIRCLSLSLLFVFEAFTFRMNYCPSHDKVNHTQRSLKTLYYEPHSTKNFCEFLQITCHIFKYIGRNYL